MTQNPKAPVQQVINDVKNYYGEVLETSADLKTSACCPTDAMPDHLKDILRQIEPEILERFYGCGSPIPEALEGATVLDLGCGTGRDSYVLSKLVGPTGQVIGVDMTDAQLEVARRHIDTHTQRFGYDKPNIRFEKGYIEDLAALHIADNSIDLVVSNCVLNLSPNKDKVFSEIFRVLKPGGELYFSDIFAGRRIPEALKNHPVLRGECLSGAMYTHDFRRLLRTLGCEDYRTISSTRITLEDKEVDDLIGMVDFYSMTVRAFKLPELEDICEDYGQFAIYKGTIPNATHFFTLDDHHTFEKGRPMAVCSNTAFMVGRTRFAPHFEIVGDLNTHYGPFDCGPAPAANVSTSDDGDQGLGCC